jgi:hypothetical protein
MHVINAETPDSGLAAALLLLKTQGRAAPSRNGTVIRAPGPVATVYRNPLRRVMLSPLRDANPFFHLYEAIWMLAGRNDAEAVARYANTMNSFASEEGKLWGAYGYRWREFFGFDQLAEIIKLIREDRTTRRAVLTMWSPVGDLIPFDAASREGARASKDVPCNTQVYFDPTQGVLDMTVCNRSNDIVWGCYGANLVHMSFLHEFVAIATGLPTGTYTQMSNNFHAYVDRPDVARLFEGFVPDDRYTDFRSLIGGRHYPIMHTEWDEYLAECALFAEQPTADNWNDPFLQNVAGPMMEAHAAYKSDRLGLALSICEDIQAPDWQAASVEWLQRRVAKRQESARKLMDGEETL